MSACNLANPKQHQTLPPFAGAYRDSLHALTAPAPPLLPTRRAEIQDLRTVFCPEGQRTVSALSEVTGFPLSLPPFLPKQGAGARRGALMPTGAFSG